MKLQSAFLATAVAMASMIGACSSSSPGPASGSGGSAGAGSGGASGSGGALTCPSATADVNPCGGDVVGTWTVTPSCLNVSGKLDITAAGLDPRSCSNATISGFLNVSGTWTANSDGTYTDGTTTTGSARIQLPTGCLNISGTTTTCDRVGLPMQGLGYNSINCTDAGAGACTCLANIQQTGGIGVPSSDPQTNGNYTIAGNVLTADTRANYSYCVSASTMNWTPQTSNPSTAGKIVFQKTGGTGSGGAPATGGATGPGGATGAGGVTSKGGATGPGGATGVGGVTSKGGATGSGGVTGGGGATPNGGATASSGGAGAGGTAAGGAAGGSTGIVGPGPCDIYAAASPATPCVAAYSMGRVLLSTYTGPLYQVRKGGGAQNLGTGGTTQDIGSKDGFGDSAAQDSFCGTDTCSVSILYDQSGKKNDLKVAPAGCYNDGSANTPDWESDAKGRSVTVGGHKVYALKTKAHEGYRDNSTTGLNTGNKDQGIYMVNDGKYFGGACCFDFGQANPDNCNGGVMNTLFFGTGYWGKGAGNGPWYEGDFEGGVWACGSGASNASCSGTPSMTMDFPFGILKTSSGKYAIKNANAQSGSLTTNYDGASPKTWANAGAIVLGIGGDNSNHSYGTFFEGAITAGRPSDATDAAVLANVQAAAYVK
jgi:hypothetical protein